MRKLVTMVLVLAVLAVFLFGCAGLPGYDIPQTEEMQRYNKEVGGGGS